MSTKSKNITKSTESTAKEQSTTSAENTDKQNYSVEAIENSPFTVVMVEDKWMVTLSNYQISDKFNTKEEAIKDAQRIDWNRLMVVITIAIRKIKTEDVMELLGEKIKD